MAIIAVTPCLASPLLATSFFLYGFGDNLQIGLIDSCQYAGTDDRYSAVNLWPCQRGRHIQRAQ